MGRRLALAFLVAIGLGGCGRTSEAPGSTAEPAVDTRPYLLERIDDAAVVRLYADGFASRTLKDKKLIWHLTQAAIAGRDIFYDQHSEFALEMREVLEQILRHPAGVAPGTLAELQRYTKLFWINNGPYNNLTARKFLLKVTPADLAVAAKTAAASGATFPTAPGQTLDQLLTRLTPMFFDANYRPAETVKTPGPGQDILSASANNLYAGVSLKDLSGFAEKYPLNSRLVKRNGRLIEEVYRIDGRYGPQIREIVGHLEAAKELATPTMARALAALVTWYRTGEATDRKAYDIAWVEDATSPVDTINGFTETYLDARGVKGAWEGLVFYVNQAKTANIQALAREAQWFEDRMPWDPKYRKAGVRGITANAIEVVVEIGDAGPVTPVGINLPNDQSVREEHGSKSISLSNVVDAYDKSTSPGFRTEFAWSKEEADRSARWGGMGSELSTNMHEVIGHASGKIEERLQGKPEAFVKEYFAALEEGRADLVGLYFIADPKLVELGILPAADHDAIVLAQYEAYTRNALVQLRRIREGTELEEDHMRNRQMVVHWLMTNTKAIERRTRDNKTYYVMVDPQAFRDGVGRLLGEVQRIKAEGDYDAAKKLFDTHGIHFDPKLRDEVVARVSALSLPSYTGFVMPRLEAVNAPDGSLADVTISYQQDLTTQMLDFSDRTRATREEFLRAEQGRRAGGR